MCDDAKRIRTKKDRSPCFANFNPMYWDHHGTFAFAALINETSVLTLTVDLWGAGIDPIHCFLRVEKVGLTARDRPRRVTAPRRVLRCSRRTRNVPQGLPTPPAGRTRNNGEQASKQRTPPSGAACPRTNAATVAGRGGSTRRNHALAALQNPSLASYFPPRSRLQIRRPPASRRLYRSCAPSNTAMTITNSSSCRT
jgi:hypothetical protein